MWGRRRRAAFGVRMSRPIELSPPRAMETNPKNRLNVDVAFEVCGPVTHCHEFTPSILVQTSAS